MSDFTLKQDLSPQHRVAVLGGEGSFHQLAASKMLGSRCSLLETNNPVQLTQAVVNGSATYGLIAVENAMAGYLHEHLNLLSTGSFQIIEEFYLNIDLYLCAADPCSTESITKVFAHPVAFRQAGRFFKQHADWEQEAVSDNAFAASRASEEKNGTAALCSLHACQTNNLTVLAESVGDLADNATRFLLFAKAGSQEIEPRKTDGEIKPHKLCCLLQPDSDTDLLHLMQNLTDLQHVTAGESTFKLSGICSLPTGHNPWQTNYYLELIFSSEQAIRSFALKLKQLKHVLKILGVFEDRQPITA